MTQYRVITEFDYRDLGFRLEKLAKKKWFFSRPKWERVAYFRDKNEAIAAAELAETEGAVIWQSEEKP